METILRAGRQAQGGLGGHTYFWQGLQGGRGPWIWQLRHCSESSRDKTPHLKYLGVAVAPWKYLNQRNTPPNWLDISGQGLCLKPFAPLPLEKSEEWRKGKEIIAAEDRGERLLGRSLKKGRDKKITKEKEKN